MNKIILSSFSFGVSSFNFNLLSSLGKILPISSENSSFFKLVPVFLEVMKLIIPEESEASLSLETVGGGSRFGRWHFFVQ